MKKSIVYEWKKPLGVKDNPYAYRWRLDFYWFSFRIHKWLCSDDERAYHSHPVNMFIVLLKGGYVDEYINKDGKQEFKGYRAPCVRVIKRDYKHIVRIPWGITWTLLFTWGAPKRWAFWDKITGKKLNRDKYFLEKGNHICK